MYAGSEQLKETVAQSSRHISVRIKINGKWHNVVKSLTLNSGSGDIVPGAALSAYIDVKMVTDEILGGMPVEVEIGLLLNDGSMEYVPMGTFYAQKPEKESGLTQFKAYDKMSLLECPFTTALTYPAKAAAVLSEACEQCSVEFDGTVDDVDISSAPAGYTCREVVGFIAGLCGKFAYIGRNGKLDFKWYENVDCTLSVSRTFSYSKGESDTYIGYVKCNVDKNTSYQSGTGSSGITFDCPYMTQEQLDVIYDRMKGMTYRSGNINFHGNPLLDIGDVVITNDLQGSYSMPVMKLVQTYTGGLNTTIEASGSVSSEGEFKGPTVRSLERVYEEFLLVNEVMANKLSAKEADILYLRVDKQSVIEADIYNAVISQADIRYAKLDEFDAYEGRINKLETEALTSESAVIHDLTSKVNKTDTMIFGAASGSTIQTEFSNSVIAQLGDAQIKSAMIESVSADKITAGAIYTNLVKIYGDSNKRLSIVDNTIQLSDDDDIVRMQIGEDAGGEYNIVIRNSDEEVIFDAIGVTEKGYHNGSIKDIAVADNANIGAEKLNIDSLFNVINTDGSHTLKSSKIYLDEQAQSLDVAFKTMTTTLDNMQNTQSSQGTQISTIQGQISSKVWQQDITAAIDNVGNYITELSTKYTDVKQTTDGLSATVANHTTQISNKAENSTVTAINSKVTSLTADLSGFKTTVSSTYTTKTEFNNLEIGSRNLIRYDNIVQYGSGTLDKSNLISAGEIIRDEAVRNGGFRFDSINCYEPSTNYVLSGYITILSGTVTNFRILNGGKVGHFFYFEVDGVKYGNPFVFGFTEINNLLNDKKEHYFVLKYQTSATIPDDTGIQYTYFQLNASDETAVQYKISRFNLQKGNKATDWTPAPEDVQQQVTAVNTIATQTANKFNWLVSSGTSATDFTLTDRMAELTAEVISLNGNVKVNGNMLVDGTITGNKLNMTEIFSRDITATNMNITGGSVKISTSDEDISYIEINSQYRSTKMTANMFEAKDTSTGIVTRLSPLTGFTIRASNKTVVWLADNYLLLSSGRVDNYATKAILYKEDIDYLHEIKASIHNGIFITSGLSLVVSGRCYIANGGYYKMDKMVFLQMTIHFNAGLSANDYWNLYAGFPRPKTGAAALSVCAINSGFVGVNACIDETTLVITLKDTLSAGYELCFSGMYLTD